MSYLVIGCKPAPPPSSAGRVMRIQTTSVKLSLDAAKWFRANGWACTVLAEVVR